MTGAPAEIAASPDWEYESGDPSVGIFGDAVYHATCALPELAEPTIEITKTEYRGEGANRVTVTTSAATCPCGARVTYTEHDADPDFPADLDSAEAVSNG